MLLELRKPGNFISLYVNDIELTYTVKYEENKRWYKSSNNSHITHVSLIQRHSRYKKNNHKNIIMVNIASRLDKKSKKELHCNMP